jgi:hypothetical protein
MNKLRQSALLGSGTSRRNKMALLAQYVADGENVVFKWKGEAYESRLLISFGGDFVECKSYDEDIKPFLKDK